MTIVKFDLKLKSILSDGYKCNQPKDMSGEYVPLAEYQELRVRYQELADSSNDAIQSLVKQRSKLQELIQRMVKVGEDLFSDPELSPNWHWKDYLIDLDKLVVDCREVLK